MQISDPSDIEIINDVGLGQQKWSQWIVLTTRNSHVKYECSSSSGSKVISRVKVFKFYKKVKFQGQGH